MCLQHTHPHTNVTSLRSAALLALSVCFDTPPAPRHHLHPLYPPLQFVLTSCRGELRNEPSCKLINTHQNRGSETFQPLPVAEFNSTKLLLCTPSIIVCSSNYIITQLMSLHHLTNSWQNCGAHLIISVARPPKLQLLSPPAKQTRK